MDRRFYFTIEEMRVCEGHIPENGVDDNDIYIYWLFAERQIDKRIDRSEIIFRNCDSDMPNTIHIKWIAKLSS